MVASTIPLGVLTAVLAAVASPGSSVNGVGDIDRSGAVLMQVSTKVRSISGGVRILEVPTETQDTSSVGTVPTFVINLATRPDRWQHMKARLAPFNASAEGRVPVLQAVRAEATRTSDDIPAEAVATSWKTERNAPYANVGFARRFYAGLEFNLTDSERACAMSHIKLWRDVARDTEPRPSLILEDDAVLSTDFGVRLQSLLASVQRVPIGADLIYLGYSVAAPLKHEVAAGVFEAEYLWTTIAYLLWPKGARTLLESLPVDQPVDNYVAWLVKTRRLKAFAASPKLAEPELAWDLASNVKHSDEEFVSTLASNILGAVVAPVRRVLAALWS